jgi:hypothetical protein
MTLNENNTVRDLIEALEGFAKIHGDESTLDFESDVEYSEIKIEDTSYFPHGEGNKGCVIMLK